MTKKEDLQQELKEKVKAGVKPSDLKRLKRSKSADDISNIPLPPPLPMVNEQLQEKQKEIENLRKQLETISAELKTTKEQLDNSLQARVESIKVFGKEYDKRKKAQQELNETIDEASSEIISTDKQVSQLRKQLSTAHQQINTLQQELKRAKIKRGNNLSDNSFTNDDLPSLTYLKYTLYSLLALWFILLLNRNWKYRQND